MAKDDITVIRGRFTAAIIAKIEDTHKLCRLTHFPKQYFLTNNLQLKEDLLFIKSLIYF